MTASIPQPLVDAVQLQSLLQGSKPVIVIDVRSEAEFAAGTVEGAVNVPLDELSARADQLPKDSTIVTVCSHGGSRSCGAAEQLRSLGFENAVALKGGVRGLLGS